MDKAPAGGGGFCNMSSTCNIGRKELFCAGFIIRKSGGMDANIRGGQGQRPRNVGRDVLCKFQEIGRWGRHSAGGNDVVSQF
ncbi:MAG: hypothetical protein IPL65_00025 [Lewinellaceae bacterium]|nr:hypothetical protein [Lewinellaceae bacterium]